MIIIHAKDADLVEKTRQMFQHMAEYLKGELTGPLSLFLSGFVCHSSLLHISLLRGNIPSLSSVTSEDYRLLENMNRLAADKYKEMNTTAASLVNSMTEIQSKCSSLSCANLCSFYLLPPMPASGCCSICFSLLLSGIFFFLACFGTFFSLTVASDEEFKPYLAQIEEIEKNVTELEKAVQMLNEYSKRLGEPLNS
jgi:hypothetical protein